MSDYEADDIPEQIKNSKQYHPFFRNLNSELKDHAIQPERLCEIVKAIHALIDQNKIIDWHRNIEVKRRVRMEMEDYFFDIAKKQYGISLSAKDIDRVITMVWNLAVENRG